MTFTDAVKFLADKAGISLPEQEYSPEEKKKADSECLELLVRRGSEIPDNEVTFKKLFDAGVKIRL
mgnify:CR=1 FL=1